MAPGRLGLVQGGVGRAHEVDAAGLQAAELGHARADGQLDGVALAAPAPVQVVGDPRSGLVGVGLVGVHEQDGELLAAQARHHVRRAAAVVQRGGGGAQRRVPHVVAEAVVHELEVVQVEDRQGQRALVAGRPRQLALELGLERAPVEQAREGVGAGRGVQAVDQALDPLLEVADHRPHQGRAHHHGQEVGGPQAGRRELQRHRVGDQHGQLDGDQRAPAQEVGGLQHGPEVEQRHGAQRAGHRHQGADAQHTPEGHEREEQAPRPGDRHHAGAERHHAGDERDGAVVAGVRVGQRQHTERGQRADREREDRQAPHQPPFVGVARLARARRGQRRGLGRGAHPVAIGSTAPPT